MRLRLTLFGGNLFPALLIYCRVFSEHAPGFLFEVIETFRIEDLKRRRVRDLIKSFFARCQITDTQKSFIALFFIRKVSTVFFFGGG